MSDDVLTEADLRDRSNQLNKTQEFYEEVSYLANPKMPCPDCAGGGMVSGGSLGDICVRCMGARVCERPGYKPLVIPPFAQLREKISEYGDALADMALPEGHTAFKGLALPPASSVPTVNEIADMYNHANDVAHQLNGQPSAVERLQLNGTSGDEGEGGDEGH